MLLWIHTGSELSKLIKYKYHEYLYADKLHLSQYSLRSWCLTK